MSKKMYKFNEWPLKPAVNVYEGEHITDEFGNLYQVDENLEYVMVKDTPLNQEEKLQTLSNKAAYRLYVKLILNDFKTAE